MLTRARLGLLVLLTCATACASPASTSVQAGAPPTPTPPSAVAAQGLPAADLPQPATGSRPWPTGRPATPQETQAYGRALQALRQRPFRVVQRDVLYGHLEVLDEDPAARLVRHSTVQGDGRVVVTELDEADRVLRAAGLADGQDVVRPGERWLAQDYHGLTDGPTLSTLDPAVLCSGTCPLQVVGPGTYLLVGWAEDPATASRVEVVLSDGRVTSWHAWYPEDVANASDAAEYAALVVDLPPDAALRSPDPATVVSVAEQARREQERRRQAEVPTQRCGPVVDGIQACAEVQGVPLPQDPVPAVAVPDGVLDAPPAPTG